MIQIKPGDAHRVRSLFETLSFNVQIPSILEGTVKGEVWVSNSHAPGVAVIWDGLLYLFLAGDHLDGVFNRSLVAWVEETVVKAIRKLGDSYFVLFYDSPGWQVQIPGIFAKYRPEPANRCFHTCSSSDYPGDTLTSSLSIHRITKLLLERPDLRGYDWIQGWITSFWHSLDDFIEEGIGYAALQEDREVVSLCLSVFKAGGQVEFGTATHPQFQNRGLSTMLASACVQESLVRGLLPVWQCWEDNYASLAVARKVGFELKRKYTVYKMYFSREGVD
jgi:RimJ/RimL family protein N-acetyltransferase